MTEGTRTLAGFVQGNITDTEPLSHTGNDGKSARGFAMLSIYLLTHPALSPTDRNVLQYMTYRCYDYSTLKRGEPTRTKATTADTVENLDLEKRQVQRSIQRLRELGLVERVRGGGPKPAQYVLRPGPWPKLGDHPGKGRWWIDQPNGRALARSWLSFFKNRPVDESNTQAWLNEVEGSMLDEPSKPKGARGFLSLPKSKAKAPPNRDATHSSEGYIEASEASIEGPLRDKIVPTRDDLEESLRDKIVPTSGSLRDKIVPTSKIRRYPQKVAKIPSSTQKSSRARAGARARLRYKNYRSIYSGVETTPIEGRACWGSPGNTSVPAGRSRLDPPPAGGALASLGVTDGLGPCENNHKQSASVLVNRVERLRQAARDLPPVKTRRRKPDYARAFQLLYKERVLDEYSASIPSFGRGRGAQVRTAVNHYGGEVMLEAIDWVFANWPAMQGGNPKLYGQDKYPPLKAFTSFALMDTYLPYIQTGEPLPFVDNGLSSMWTREVHKWEVDRPNEEGFNLLGNAWGGREPEDAPK